MFAFDVELNFASMILKSYNYTGILDDETIKLLIRMMYLFRSVHNLIFILSRCLFVSTKKSVSNEKQQLTQSAIANLLATSFSNAGVFNTDVKNDRVNTGWYLTCWYFLTYFMSFFKLQLIILQFIKWKRLEYSGIIST